MKSRSLTKDVFAPSFASLALILGALTAVSVTSVRAEARGFGTSREGFANEVPKQLVDVAITPHLGEKIDLDTKFVDDAGQEVTLRKYTADGKPILLSLAYYSCPSLCNYHLNGLNQAFKQLKQPVGKEFNFVVVSIDPREGTAVASAKKANYLKEYGRTEGEAGWHFLTASAAASAALAKSIGFKYHWEEEEKQYAHASSAYAIAPDGTISRYLPGIVFDPKTIRLAMLEASQGHVGTVIDKLILYCFHLDEKTNKVTLAAMNIMRAGGILVLLVLGAFLVPFWIRARKDNTPENYEGDR